MSHRFLWIIGCMIALGLLMAGCSTGEEEPAPEPGAAAPSAVRFEATQFDQMYAVYEENRRAGRPTFITSDSVLHTTHVLFDYTLRAAESRQLDGNLRQLTARMFDRMSVLLEEELKKQYIIAPPPYGYDRVTAYFGVAMKLLAPETPMPPAVAPLVNREVALITAHAGEAVSPIMGVTEDYTQYTPRGHYTRNERLSRFFQAMMWYGRVGFPISGEKSPGMPLTREEMRANALAGVLLSRQLEATDPAAVRLPGVPTITLWRNIYNPSAFLVGQSDDLTPPEYARLSREIFDETLPGGWVPQAQADTDRFIAAAIALRPPKIIGGDQAGRTPPVSLRLFGRRFTADSAMLQRLVAPHVPGRTLPSGLDVMAALGSPAAEKVLYDRGEFRNAAYSEAMSQLRMEFNARDNAGQWATAYDHWLHALRALVGDRSAFGQFPANYPGTARPAWWDDPAWMAKQLNAGLGSWAELRHDTILYVKQSYSPRAVQTVEPSPIVYVEPVPQVYGALIRLLSATREGLTAQGVFPAELGANYDEMTRLLRALLLISTQETLTAEEQQTADVEKPTADDRQQAANIGAILRRVETLPTPLRAEITGSEDARVALIADVHTDLTTGRVLEVAVGKVLAVVVPVPDAKPAAEARGPIFSYYEFTQPIADRLTDAAWQQQIATGKTPGLFVLQPWMK
ncbi:MAG: DUF3160 domain-containing protein [Armatimonadota bacterium]